jgi:hypothetical protein
MVVGWFIIWCKNYLLQLNPQNGVLISRQNPAVDLTDNITTSLSFDNVFPEILFKGISVGCA